MTGKQLKNAILQLAIQGKLVPLDPKDEPASVLLVQIRKEKEQLLKAGKLKKKDLETTPISDEEKPFEIPGSWEWVRLKDILFSLTDGTHSTPHYTTSGIPFLSVKDMSSGTISFDRTKFISEEEHSDLIKRCNPQKGDILLSKVGTTGIPVKIDTDIPFSIFVSLALLKFNSTSIYADFLVYLISSPLVQLQVQENTRGVGNKNWVLNDIANTIIPLPPLAEQHRIVSKIEELMPLVEEYGVAQEKLNRLNEALPEALKKSILQQAIQGKLVPQDANDEPASALLAQIRKEKEQLLKAGKLKKKDLATTPITDEEKPFEIPESWEWCKIGEFADIINGFTPLRTNPEFWNNGNIAWFTVDDIHEQGRIIKKTNQHISTKALAKNSSRILPIDTLLLCCTASVGEYALTKIPLTTNQQFNGITIRKEYTRLVSPYYLFAIAPQFKGWLLNLAGKTTFNFVSVKKVSELIIPLPPLAEQQRIVAKIEELLAMVDGMK